MPLFITSQDYRDSPPKADRGFSVKVSWEKSWGKGQPQHMFQSKKRLWDSVSEVSPHRANIYMGRSQSMQAKWSRWEAQRPPPRNWRPSGRPTSSQALPKLPAILVGYPSLSRSYSAVVRLRLRTAYSKN
jgi:hypothetical protein